MALPPGSRQDFEAAEPIRPVNFKIPPVDREHPPYAFALGHPHRRRIGRVHGKSRYFHISTRMHEQSPIPSSIS